MKTAGAHTSYKIKVVQHAVPRSAEEALLSDLSCEIGCEKDWLDSLVARKDWLDSFVFKEIVQRTV